MYLIIGRTASGKDTLANMLTNYGLTGVISRTTRPKRTEDEDTHIFCDAETAALDTDRIATTTINGYDYYTIEDDLVNKSYYIIDVNGMYDICAHAPEEDFHIIYVHAPEDTRRKRFLARQIDLSQEEALALWTDRNMSEAEQFDKLENVILSAQTTIDVILPANIGAIKVIENDDDNNLGTLNAFAEELFNESVAHRRLIGMLRHAVYLGILKCDAEGKIIVYHRDQDEPKPMSFEDLADQLLYSPDDLRSFMTLMLIKSPIFEEFCKD